jgi:hypothetical protein
MNKIEKKMLDILKKLRDQYGVIGVKAVLIQSVGVALGAATVFVGVTLIEATVVVTIAQPLPVAETTQ